jgi:hypothetical protein
MALMVEGIVDGGVHAEEALGGCCRLEPLHLALSPSHDLVGVLGPIIFAEPLVVTTRQMEVSERGVARLPTRRDLAKAALGIIIWTAAVVILVRRGVLARVTIAGLLMASIIVAVAATPLAAREY